jgi:ABC-type nitrate/sulfonate/bicarbonate transport system permease component
VTVGTRQIAQRGRQGHPPRTSLRVPGLNPRLAWGLLGFAVVIVSWELISQLGLVKKVLISSPSAIVQVAMQDFFVTGYIYPHLAISFYEYLIGFGLAAVTGIVLGLLLGMNRRLQYLMEPWLDAIYATPTVAFVPLIIIILGIGLTQKVFVVWLEAIFVIVVTVMAGVHAADQRHLDTARSFRASKWLRFRSVILPTSVPFILTGMRLGATRALVGVVVAELFASNAGIGFYINFSGTTLRTDRVMLGVILLGVFGIVVGEIIRRIENRFERWRPAIK